MNISRPSRRGYDELRKVSISRNFTESAAASVLIEFGKTKVICAASLRNSVPRFLQGKNVGWLTAEYGMLPSATSERTEREAAAGKQTGRTIEIQRLIGRSLRQCVNLNRLGERTIQIDCDVIQADGGTRTASITGACVAVYDALRKRNIQGVFDGWVSAISVGIYAGVPILDLDYAEDFKASTDMNVVCKQNKGFVEIQGTAEAEPFPRKDLDELLRLAELGTSRLYELQEEAMVERSALEE